VVVVGAGVVVEGAGVIVDGADAVASDVVVVVGALASANTGGAPDTTRRHSPTIVVVRDSRRAITITTSGTSSVTQPNRPWM
jgi:hypothetical protein